MLLAVSSLQELPLLKSTRVAHEYYILPGAARIQGLIDMPGQWTSLGPKSGLSCRASPLGVAEAFLVVALQSTSFSAHSPLLPSLPWC